MLGREYTARYLSAATRSRAEEIATNVRERARRRDRPRHAPERSRQGRGQGQARQRSRSRSARPRRDLDYTVQPMGRGSFGSNMLIASTWRHREEMKRIGRGNADRRWDVLPQQPALAYDIAQNRLIVTAAMLQAPVLDTRQGHRRAVRLLRRAGRTRTEPRHRQQAAAWSTPSRKCATGGRQPKPARGTRWATASPRSTALRLSRPVAGTQASTATQVRDVAIADQAGVELAWAAFERAAFGEQGRPAGSFYNGWASLWPQQLSRGRGDRARRQRRACAGPVAHERAVDEPVRVRRSLRLQGQPRRCRLKPISRSSCGRVSRRARLIRKTARTSRRLFIAARSCAATLARDARHGTLHRTTRIRGGPLATERRLPAPVADQQPAEQHPAQVGEMRHARHAVGDAQQQFDRRRRRSPACAPSSGSAGISSITRWFGNSMPYASSKPKMPPDAPTVG